MISSILQLLVLLLPVILTAIAQHNSAANKLSRTNERIDEDIAKHNAADITLLVNDALSKLPDADGSNKQ